MIFVDAFTPRNKICVLICGSFEQHSVRNLAQRGKTTMKKEWNQGTKSKSAAVYHIAFMLSSEELYVSLKRRFPQSNEDRRNLLEYFFQPCLQWLCLALRHWDALYSCYFTNLLQLEKSGEGFFTNSLIGGWSMLWMCWTMVKRRHVQEMPQLYFFFSIWWKNIHRIFFPTAQ